MEKRDEKNKGNWNKSGARMRRSKNYKTFLRRKKAHEDGESKGEGMQLNEVPMLREEWDRMYEWILVLMGCIDGMVCWKSLSIRRERVKHVLGVAAVVYNRKRSRTPRVK